MSRELLFSVTKKDFDIKFFSGRGAGGQFRNKHQNCIRMKHRDSGVSATGQSHREQKANMKEAFNGIVKNVKFKMWLNNKINQYMMSADEKEKLKEKVNEMMKEEYLKIEYAMS